MPLLWTPRTIPELAAVKRLPPEERSRVWGRCWPRIRRHWQFWVAAAVAVALLAGVSIPVSRLLSDAGVTGLPNGLLAGIAGGLLAGTLFAQVVNRVAVPYLRAELAGPPDPGTKPAEPGAAADGGA